MRWEKRKIRNLLKEEQREIEKERDIVGYLNKIENSWDFEWKTIM